MPALRRAMLFAPGPLLAAGLGAVVVPLMTWVFPPADLGRMNVLQMTVAVAVVALFLGLDQAYVREYHEETVGTRLLYAICMYPPLLGLLVGAMLVAVSPSTVARVLYGIADAGLAWGTVAAVGVALVVRSWTLIVRMQERGIVFSVAQVIPRVAMIAGILAVAALALSADFATVMLLVVLSSATALVPLGVSTWRTWARTSPRADGRLLRRLLAFGFPLALAALAYTLLTALGTVSLRLLSSFDQLGLYAVATSVAGVAVVLQTIFSVVWAPALYRSASHAADDARRLVSAVREAVLAIVTVAFALAGAFSWLVDLFVPPAYDAVKYLVIGALVQPLLYTLSEVTGAGIGVTRRSRFALIATLASMAVGIAASLALVPPFGAVGAIAATSVALFVLFVIRAEVSARIWHSYPRTRMYALVGGAVTLVLVSLALGSAHYLWIPLVWSVFGVVSVVFCRRFWVRLFTRGLDAVD